LINLGLVTGYIPPAERGSVLGKKPSGCSLASPTDEPTRALRQLVRRSSVCVLRNSMTGLRQILSTSKIDRARRGRA
jgi:hypothetical protein